MTNRSLDSRAENSPEVKSDQDASSRRMNVGVVVSIFMVLCLVFVSGCGQAPTPTRTVSARLNFEGNAVNTCQGVPPFTDIGPETLTTLRDGAGEILGQKKLGEGFFLNNPFSICVFQMYFENVPTDRDSYTFEVGLRGKVEKSKDEMDLGSLYDPTLWVIGAQLSESTRTLKRADFN